MTLRKTPLPTTTVQLLASYQDPGEFPEDHDPRRVRVYLSRRRHNIKVNIAFSHFQLRKHMEKDELYLTLCDVKQQGSIALRTVADMLRPRPLKNLNTRLGQLNTQCDTLSQSVRHMFLLLDPQLEGRLPAAL